jgi:hypothetical protein
MSDHQSRCLFCDTPGPIVCGAPKCQKYDREIQEDQDRAAREDLRAAIRAAFSQRCKPSARDWNLRRSERWFYTAKCLLCVLLRREGRPKSVKSYAEAIEVGCHHNAKLYAGWEARWIQVGHGVLRNWWYEIVEDGEWNM